MTGQGLALYTPQEQVQLAADVWPMANRLADTAFVPKGLRGSPEAVMACMVKGAELGIPLMQSLAQIHVIEGRPAMSAELMRAIVLARGHEIVIEETTTTTCTIGVKRAGGERWSKFTRQLHDYQHLKGKDNWKNYPADMLMARTTAVACRAVFPDVIGGISYTLEELTDGDVIDDRPATAESAPATRPATARARRAATRGAEPAPATGEPAAPPAAKLPPLPGEEDDIVDAEIVDSGPSDEVAKPEEDQFPPVADDDPPVADPGDRGLPAGAAISKAMAEHGVTKREDKLRACSQFVGREVGSSNDLSDAERSALVGFLAGLGDGVPFPFDVGEGSDGEPHAVDEPVTVPPAPVPPPRQQRAPSVSLESWSADQWRSLISARKVKASEFLREAKRLAAAAGVAAPSTIEEVAGLGIAEDLHGWVEDLGLERRPT